jgi:hypothetical protein
MGQIICPLGRALRPIRRVTCPPGHVICPLGRITRPIGRTICPLGPRSRPMGRTTRPPADLLREDDRSLRRVKLCEPGDGDPVDVLEGEATQGVEQPGEVAGCGGEGVDGVQGGEEVFVEVAGVTGEEAFQEDGKALLVWIGAEPVAQAPAGARENGGGELCRFFLREGRKASSKLGANPPPASWAAPPSTGGRSRRLSARRPGRSGPTARPPAARPPPRSSSRTSSREITETRGTGAGLPG